MPKGMTSKQEEVLGFILTFFREAGFPPTVREVAGRFTCSVKGAYDHILALEKKGIIKRDKKRSRSILIDPRIVQNYLMGSRSLGIPLVGKIAAGTPVLAEQNIEDYILPNVPLKDGSTYFALRVQGDSMSDVGIFDGDVVVLRSQSAANDGEIVAALVNDEAILKYYHRARNAVRLRSANPSYPDFYVKDVKVLGKLHSLYRTYA